MNYRLLCLGLIVGVEILAGIGLRNENLAARARAEISRRKILLTEARLQEHEAVMAWWLSPDALIRRLTLNDQVAAAQRRPAL